MRIVKKNDYFCSIIHLNGNRSYFMKHLVLSVVALFMVSFTAATQTTDRYVGKCHRTGMGGTVQTSNDGPIWRPLNEVFMTYSAANGVWADTIKAYNTYDQAGNIIERIELEDNGYDVTHMVYEYNENNKEICCITENDNGNTGYYTKSSKRVRAYDSICTDFAIMDMEYSWDDVENDWKLYNAWKKEITRDANGNITGILISAYFSFLNDYEGGYVPVTRITIEYGMDNKAKNYIYEVSWGYDEETKVTTWRGSSYCNIIWENTNGQLIEDVNRMLVGENRMKSAQMYAQNSKLENEFEGWFTVQYEKDSPDFIQTIYYEGDLDKEIHSYTTLDANGSYCEKFANYSDGEMNRDGVLDEQDLFSITWEEVTYDEKGSMILFEEFITEGDAVAEQLAGNRMTYEYDAVCGEIEVEVIDAWTPVYVDYVLQSASYEPHSRLVYSGYVDVTKQSQIELPATDFSMRVYSLQGEYLGNTVDGLPQGIYIICQGTRVYKAMNR